MHGGLNGVSEDPVVYPGKGIEDGRETHLLGRTRKPREIHPVSEGLKELHQILPFSLRQAQVHVLIIVIDDIVEGLKAAIMVKTTALSTPQSSKWCSPIHVRG